MTQQTFTYKSGFLSWNLSFLILILKWAQRFIVLNPYLQDFLHILLTAYMILKPP